MERHLAALVLFGVLAGCGSSAPALRVQTNDDPKDAPSQQSPSSPASNPRQATPNGDSQGQIEEPPSLLLRAAHAAPDAELPLTVATLDFELLHGDFAQIVRCSGDQDWLVEGVPLVGSSPMAAAVWREALSASESCQIVSLRALPGLFQDAVVPETGAPEVVRYILNPCKMDPAAPGDPTAALCSHGLAVSPALPVQRTDSGEAAVDPQALADALRSLATARSRAEGLATRLRALGANTLNLVPICEKEAARERAFSQLRWGLGQLATIGVNAALSQGGPILGLPVIQTTIRAAVKGLFESPDLIPAACQGLRDNLGKIKELSGQHDEALKSWENAAQHLEKLRGGP